MSVKRPDSVVLGTDRDVLERMLPFYVRDGGHIIDVTANRRRMWKGVTPSGPITYCDVDPAHEPDITCPWDDVPLDDGSAAAIVFDPPHLPKAAASSRSLQVYIEQYGLSLSEHDESGPAASWVGFLVEAKRLLEPDGVIIAKIKDYVHNHRYQWTLSRWIRTVEAIDGLTPCDLVVKVDPCGGNLKSGRWKRAYHVRNAHCYFPVVRKGRCEPRKRP